MVRLSIREAISKMLEEIEEDSVYDITFFPRNRESDRRSIVRIARQHGWTVRRDGMAHWRHTTLVAPNEGISITVFDR